MKIINKFVVFLIVILCIFISECNSYPSYDGPPYTYYGGGEGTGTFYTYPDEGTCGYGNLFGPKGPKTNNIIAVNAKLFNETYQCGQCYNVTVGCKSLVVMVTDKCPDAGWCDRRNTHFDFYIKAFDQLQDRSVLGYITNLTFYKIPCPIIGNMHIQLKSPYTPYYQSFLIFNHTIGIDHVDLLFDNGTVHSPMKRTEYNFWESKLWGSIDINKKFKLRITSILGESVTTEIENGWAEKIYDTGVQFSQMPDPNAPQPFYYMSSSPILLPSFSFLLLLSIVILFM